MLFPPVVGIDGRRVLPQSDAGFPRQLMCFLIRRCLVKMAVMPCHTGLEHFEVYILDFCRADHADIPSVTVCIPYIDSDNLTGYHGCQVVLGFLRVRLTALGLRCVYAMQTDAMLLLVNEQREGIAVAMRTTFPVSVSALAKTQNTRERSVAVIILFI